MHGRVGGWMIHFPAVVCTSLPSTTRRQLPGARCRAVTGFSRFTEEFSNEVESQGLQ
jgi:hypothetical protein